MTTKTIRVRAKNQGTAIATQYLGQEDFENVHRVYTDGRGRLGRLHANAPSKGLQEQMGYEIRMGEFLPIKHGDWVVTIRGVQSWPFPAGDQTLIMSNDEFQLRYEQE